MSAGARTGRATSLLDRMTRWGQMYDQEINAFRLATDRASAKNELLPVDRVDDHLTDMESLADGAANIMSSLHVLLDEFLATPHPGVAAAKLNAALTDGEHKVGGVHL